VAEALEAALRRVKAREAERELAAVTERLCRNSHIF
jgi:hypothetical protein